MLDFKPKQKKEFVSFVRLDEKLNNQVLILVRKHQVPKSTVIRSLIEAGLKNV